MHSSQAGWLGLHVIARPEHLFDNVSGVEDGLEAHELERLRRSLAMLRPGQPAGLTREHAI
jgi:hypothetical protein